MTNQIILHHRSGVKKKKRLPNDVVTHTCKNKKEEKGLHFQEL